MLRKCLILPVPVVFLLMALTLQLPLIRMVPARRASSSGCETSACHTWGTGCASCCGAYLKLGEGGRERRQWPRKRRKTLQQRKNVVRHRLARRKREASDAGRCAGSRPITLDTPTAVLRTRRGARRRALPENWCSRGEHLRPRPRSFASARTRVVESAAPAQALVARFTHRKNRFPFRF